MDDLMMIWEEVINMLDLELNELQLTYWIKPLVPIFLNEEELIMDAKSGFIRNMVEKKYRANIEKYISYICKRPIRLVMTEPSQSNYYVLTKRADVEADGQLRFEEGKENSQEERETAPRDPKGGLSLDRDREQLKKLQEEKQVLQNHRKTNGYMTLNPKYTMDSFVRGKSNDFAYATAKAVVSNPGHVYNPLFIYGLSGLGKTHLMQAIAHEILDHDPEKRVHYITSEKFMNELIAMIENGTNAEKENFRRKYRSIDVLLMDDIQFIAGKKATMEEIFHTFNDLKEANKQIVLSSDKPPKELKNLEERLVTRFEGGMTVDIQQPDFETRVAILNHKMKGESILLPQNVVEYIAKHITANIRELEGALLRVIAFFRYKKVDPDLAGPGDNLDLAQEALKLEEQNDIIISIEDICKRVVEYYNLEANDLQGKSRQSSIAFPRQVAMYLSRKLTNLSLVAIGRFYNRDHTTVMHAIDKVASQTEKETAIKEDVDALIDQLSHR